MDLGGVPAGEAAAIRAALQSGALPPGLRTEDVRAAQRAQSELRAAGRQVALLDLLRGDSARRARPMLSSGTRAAIGPQRIGPYELQGELGRGGMGVVYRARDPNGAPVAVKVLVATFNAEAAARFDLEARASQRLRHPNIVSVHAAGEVGGRRYLVMDLVDGEGLDALLRREGQLAEPRAAELTLKLGRALAAAHAQHLLHRDVKPPNVLVTATGEPVLTDFGLARSLAPSDQRLTASGEVVGTPSYMAPEQARGEPVDARTDVYQLGATLYELLTGRPPFIGEGPIEILRAVTTTRPESPSRHRPGLDAELERICLRAIAPDPAERYAGAADLVRELEAFLLRTRRRKRRARSERGTRRLPYALGFVALLLVGLGIAFVASRPADVPVAVVTEAPPPSTEVAPPPLIEAVPPTEAAPPPLPVPVPVPVPVPAPAASNHEADQEDIFGGVVQMAALRDLDARLSRALDDGPASMAERLALVDEVLTRAPGYGRGRYVRGCIHMAAATRGELGAPDVQLAAALTDFDAARAAPVPYEGPDLARARGALLYQLGRHAEAFPDLELAWRSFPDDPNVGLHVAYTASVLGKIELAVSTMEQLERRGLGGWQVPFQLGSFFMEHERWTEALAALQRAHAASPPMNGWPMARAGEVLVKLQRFDEAEQALAEAARLGAQDPSVLWHVHAIASVSRRHRGHLQQAVDEARKAIAAVPATPDGYRLLAEALRDLGRVDEARTAVRDGLARAPKDASLLALRDALGR